MPDLAQLLEQKLKVRVSMYLRRRYGFVDERRLSIELNYKREILADLLIQTLDAFDEVRSPPPAAPAPAAAPEANVPGTKETPSKEILDKAAKLQTLAIQSPEANERANAWAQFEKLWQRYTLPTNLGM